MLMMRRKLDEWVRCVNKKTGEVLSFQIKEVHHRTRGGYQITIAIQDDAYNYRVLKPGERLDNQSNQSRSE